MGEANKSPSTHSKEGFTAGFYWYGTKRKGLGRPPRWVEQVLMCPEQARYRMTGLMAL